jgi:membrane-bound lytic murein transglycosylase B
MPSRRDTTEVAWTLDGTLPGNEVIVQSNADGQVTYARAMGPMQFLPGTWAR